MSSDNRALAAFVNSVLFVPLPKIDPISAVTGVPGAGFIVTGTIEAAASPAKFTTATIDVPLIVNIVVFPVLSSLLHVSSFKVSFAEFTPCWAPIFNRC